MSGILRFGMKGGFHYGFDLIFFGALPTDLARRFVLQASHPAFQKMIAPQKDGRPTGLQMLSDASIGQPLMRQQANARSQHNLLRRRRSPDPILELIPLLASHGERIGGLSHAPRIADDNSL